MQRMSNFSRMEMNEAEGRRLTMLRLTLFDDSSRHWDMRASRQALERTAL